MSTPVSALPKDRPDGDRPGHVEVLGYDYIPESERHGEPRELFGVWAPARLLLSICCLAAS